MECCQSTRRNENETQTHRPGLHLACLYGINYSSGTDLGNRNKKKTFTARAPAARVFWKVVGRYKMQKIHATLHAILFETWNYEGNEEDIAITAIKKTTILYHIE